MEALSWFKFCPAKWNMGKTKKLSMEDKAEYLDLCSSYWVGGCVMSADEMREHSDCIDTFFRRGLIGDDGIDWLNAQHEEATRKSTAASKAANTRWQKKEQSERNANAMRTHSECNASVMQRREEERRGDREEEIDRKIDRENETRVNANSPEKDFLVSGNSEYPNTHTTEPQEKEKVLAKTKRFETPTETQVQLFFQTTESPQAWEGFYNYYLANGWRVGKNPMRDWQAAARNWVSREKEFVKNKPQYNGQQPAVTEDLMRNIGNDVAAGGWDFTKD